MASVYTISGQALKALGNRVVGGVYSDSTMCWDFLSKT